MCGVYDLVAFENDQSVDVKVVLVEVDRLMVINEEMVLVDDRFQEMCVKKGDDIEFQLGIVGKVYLEVGRYDKCMGIISRVSAMNWDYLIQG